MIALLPISITLPTSYSNRSVLFLQVDNRPCPRHAPATCFLHATEAASFLRAVMSLNRASLPFPPDLQAIVSVRGLREEIGGREEDKVEQETGRSLCAVVTGIRTSRKFDLDQQYTYIRKIQIKQCLQERHCKDLS